MGSNGHSGPLNETPLTSGHIVSGKNNLHNRERAGLGSGGPAAAGKARGPPWLFLASRFLSATAQGTFEGLCPQLVEKKRVPQTNRAMGTDERDIRTKYRRPSEAAAMHADADSAPG